MSPSADTSPARFRIDENIGKTPFESAQKLSPTGDSHPVILGGRWRFQGGDPQWPASPGRRDPHYPFHGNGYFGIGDAHQRCVTEPTAKDLSLSK
jgi:hypothetical protein